MDMMIDANGINISADVCGEGEPVVLIHGLGGNKTRFCDLAKELSKNFTVITYDCRGHGLSDKPESYKLGDHADDLFAVADRLGFDKISVLGISAGSYIAQAAAIKNARRIEKMVLVVSRARGDVSSTDRFWKAHPEEDRFDAKKREEFFFKKVFHNIDAIKTSGILEDDAPLTEKQAKAASDALSGFDFRNELRNVKAKTLVISGKYDILNTAEEGREIAKLIPGAKYAEMENSGHFPQYEEPEMFLETVRNFLI